MNNKNIVDELLANWLQQNRAKNDANNACSKLEKQLKEIVLSPITTNVNGTDITVGYIEEESEVIDPQLLADYNSELLIQCATVSKTKLLEHLPPSTVAKMVKLDKKTSFKIKKVK